MDRMLYLECYSGISGDMTVAALLDLGADRSVLEKALASLPVHGFRIKIGRVLKSGLDSCDFEVILDHSMDGHGSGSRHSHEKHAHGHRSLSQIMEIIDRADITANSRTLATRIFRILAEAESKAHGVELEQVHFHEVGAIDSIVDIVSAAVCIDNLRITDVIVPELYEGKGLVRCQHGLLPIPVPAVSSIVADHGLHLHIMDVEGEHVTPTGAAIVAALRTSDKLPEVFTIQRIGIGAGKRITETPGILRAIIISGEPDRLPQQSDMGPK
jgi:pyridinium-3,5-bisthiocarboxylic acid mononucleotide nickel chelatase